MLQNGNEEEDEEEEEEEEVDEDEPPLCNKTSDGFIGATGAPSVDLQYVEAEGTDECVEAPENAPELHRAAPAAPTLRSVPDGTLGRLL